MRPEIKNFKRCLGTDPTVLHFSNRFFSYVNDNKEAEQFLLKALESCTNQYSLIPDIEGREKKPGTKNTQLQNILKTIPSFIFVICNELDKQPDYRDHSRSLRISGIASYIAEKSNFTLNVSLFLKHINPEDELDILEEKITDLNSSHSYFPKILHQDFLLMTKNHQQFKSAKSSHFLIEILYYFTGIKQIFIKYYFNLLCKAQNDIVATHINNIFSQLFTDLNELERKYWNQYKNGQRLQKRLYNTIEKDSEDNRHIELRKHVFESIKSFNPVIQDGSTKNPATEDRKLLMSQLAQFHSLSFSRLVLLLNTIQEGKGKNHITFLLSHMFRTNNEKLFQLSDHLSQTDNEQNKELNRIFTSFLRKMPRSKGRSAHLEKAGKTSMESVYKTAESLRKTYVKKSLTSSKGKRGITHDHIPKFLENRLEKLYERVKIEGALTKDQIPEYLSKFVDSAETVISVIPESDHKPVVEEFLESTAEILRDISDKGQLTTEEVQTYKTNIEEKAENLDTPDVKKRTEIVDEIGVTLTDASYESDKREKAKRVDSFLSKELIPYGLDKKAKRMSIKDFFTFPFGDYQGPEDDDWFGYHMRYLQLAVKANKLDKSNFVKIFSMLSSIPQVRYKKYFNIFPNNQFEETTFMAVYDLWQNRAFEKLKATQKSADPQ